MGVSSASPDILSGMRLSLTVALILSVVCEILAGLDGLGHWVLLSARSFRSADLFAGVILLGVIGYLTALAVSVGEKRLLQSRADSQSGCDLAHQLHVPLSPHLPALFYPALCE